MKKFLTVLLACTWEAFQNLIGLIVIGWNKLINNGLVKETWDGVTYYKVSNLYGSGVSLGRFIILDRGYTKEKNKVGEVPLLTLTVHHEDGHRKQSLMLGPLYIFVIGIPSAIHNLYNRGLTKKMSYVDRMREYYSFWCEKHADELGGITEKRKQYLDEYTIYGTTNKSSGK